MKNRWIFLVLLLGLAACGPTAPELEQTDSEIPRLEDGSLALNPFTRQMQVQVKALDNEPATLTVSCSVSAADSTLILPLNDAGVEGDHIPGDGIYAAAADWFFSDTIEINLALRFEAKDADGNEATPQIVTSTISPNLAPQILSISSPDTVIRPASGLFDTLIVVAEIYDPNGPEDIVFVGFEVQNVDDPQQWFSSPSFYLHDTGIGADAVAADQQYSAGLEISSTNRLARNIFRYQAKDRAGNFSLFAYDTIVVYEDLPPEILGFSIENDLIPKQVGDETPLRLFLEIRDDNGPDDISAIRLFTKGPQGIFTEVDNFSIHNDGSEGDLSADDDIFTINAYLSETAAFGDWLIYATASDRRQNETQSDTLSFALLNLAPDFTNIIYNSAISRPASATQDTIFFTVSDENGLNDIESVTYREKSPDNGEFSGERAALQLSGATYFIPLIWDSQSATGTWFYRIWVRDRSGELAMRTLSIQVSQ
jgi:hypothetical protein